ncbi:MAG TPA: urate hydroxylase PuuD [Candidatus Eisenbacteria bacterium]
MPAFALEWLNLVLRWAHVIAAIMWIGDSFLFMWLDSSLTPPTRKREGAVAGELWMVHSGGFYEVVKRRYLAPDELPAHLHWFKWEAYSTWISGFFLLGVVYYLGGGIYLLDRSVSPITLPWAIALSLGLLATGWLVYDALWTSPLARSPRAAALVSFALLTAAAFGLTRVFSGRAAFLHFGAMIGTVMVANVWRRIIPAQSRMLAATRAGEPVDVTLGERAKTRSIHNHYLTLPVLFTMLSNHFPGTWGHPLAWLTLVLLVVLGASVKYVMNFGARSNRWVVLAGLASLAGAIVLAARSGAPAGGAEAYRGEPPVAFETVQAIVEQRCVTCHAARPTNPAFPEPPLGVRLDEPERIARLAPRILVRAVVTKTMPLGNLTGMTEEERRTLGAWIAQGAKLEGAHGGSVKGADR